MLRSATTSTLRNPHPPSRRTSPISQGRKPVCSFPQGPCPTRSLCGRISSSHLTPSSPTLALTFIGERQGPARSRMSSHGMPGWRLAVLRSTRRRIVFPSFPRMVRSYERRAFESSSHGIDARSSSDMGRHRATHRLWHGRARVSRGLFDVHLPKYRSLTDIHQRAHADHCPGEYPQTNHHVQEISRNAHARDIIMHLDGARVWHVAIETGLSLEEICDPFDSVSLCLYKGLGKILLVPFQPAL